MSPGRAPFLLASAAVLLLGLSAVLLARSLWAMATEPGATCGIGEGGALAPDHCPRGVAWLLPSSFAALIVAVPAVVLGLRRSGVPRRTAALLVPVMLVGAVAAVPLFGRLHDSRLVTVWAAPAEQPAGAESEGGWAPGPLVVRARFDGLAAYGLADGRAAWSYRIEDPHVLCAMSRSAQGGAGLVGHGEEGGPCTSVTAVDMTTGRALWTTTVGPASPATNVQADIMATAGDTAVVATDLGIRAFALRTGTDRWSLRPPARCRFEKVAAGADQVIAGVRCDGGRPRVRAVDAVTGRTRWETELPLKGGYATVRPLSAAPPVVDVRESGTGGAEFIAAFDEAGRITARIQKKGGGRQIEDYGGGFDAIPDRHALVAGPAMGAAARTAAGHLLVVRARDDHGDPLLQAYDLADGRVRWSARAPQKVRTMALDGRRAVVLDDALLSARLRAVSLTDGAITDLGPIQHGSTSEMELFVVANRYVLLSESASAPYSHPVMAVRSF